jgi:hypothetical protein
MAVDDKWGRWSHYQKTGKWPMTSRQERGAIRKNKRDREFQKSLGKVTESPVAKANRLRQEQEERDSQNRLF